MSEAVSVSSFVEAALYDPETGFYETGGTAGPRGDFVTSPEVGPLFGAVLGRALDSWWDDLGRPEPFVVHEHGAGPGTLARAVVRSAPRCAAALRWALVERSAAQRARHPAHLPHVGAVGDGPWHEPGAGPLVASAATRPDGPAHVVVANELLDNLPFDLAERRADGWAEVRVTPAGEERTVPHASGVAERLDLLAPEAPVGARVPMLDQARAWVAASLAQLHPGGRLVVLDYGVAATAELADRAWTEWVRTYRGHSRGGHPWDAPGSVDVTVEVAYDQLPAPDRLEPQADALRRWGIAGLVDEGRAAWQDRAAPTDLATLTLRSRLAEAEALLDPAGLGGFWVGEWAAPPD